MARFHFTGVRKKHWRKPVPFKQQYAVFFAGRFIGEIGAVDDATALKLAQKRWNGNPNAFTVHPISQWKPKNRE